MKVRVKIRGVTFLSRISRAVLNSGNPNLKFVSANFAASIKSSMSCLKPACLGEKKCSDSWLG